MIYSVRAGTDLRATHESFWRFLFEKTERCKVAIAVQVLPLQSCCPFNMRFMVGCETPILAARSVSLMPVAAFASASIALMSLVMKVSMIFFRPILYAVE